MMRGHARISSIYSKANAEPPKGAEADRRNHEAYRDAWQRHGLIVIDPDTVLDDWTRQALINEAKKQYGERR